MRTALVLDVGGEQQVEILLWIKFFPQPLMNASTPPEVKLPWLATLSLFSLWGLLFVAVSEDSATAAAAAGGGSAAGASSAGGGGGVASASESMNSMGSLLDGSSGSVGEGSSAGGGEGEKEGGGGSNGSVGSKADGAAAVAGAEGDADDTKPRRRNR